MSRSPAPVNADVFERMKRTSIPFDHYEVEIVLLTDLLGTVAKEERVRSEYIASKAPKPEMSQGETETGPDMDKLERKGATGFHGDEYGLFVYDYWIKGYLKEAADALKGVKVDGPLGIKQAKSKIDNFVFVGPRRIRLLGQDGNPIRRAHGHIERPLRAMTAQGPRVSLAGSDFIKAGSLLQFEIIVLPSEFREKHIKMILDYGLVKGLGQWRNGGYGRFEVLKLTKT